MKIKLNGEIKVDKSTDVISEQQGVVFLAVANQIFAQNFHTLNEVKKMIRLFTTVLNITNEALAHIRLINELADEVVADRFKAKKSPKSTKQSVKESPKSTKPKAKKVLKSKKSKTKKA